MSRTESSARARLTLAALRERMVSTRPSKRILLSGPHLEAAVIRHVALGSSSRTRSSSRASACIFIRAIARPVTSCASISDHSALQTSDTHSDDTCSIRQTLLLLLRRRLRLHLSLLDRHLALCCFPLAPCLDWGSWRTNDQLRHGKRSAHVLTTRWCPSQARLRCRRSKLHRLRLRQHHHYEAHSALDLRRLAIRRSDIDLVSRLSDSTRKLCLDLDLPTKRQRMADGEQGCASIAPSFEATR